MYGLLWRVLPGPWWVKALILVVLAAVVVVALFEWAFPALYSLLQLDGQTIG